jgi:hypothetical protein
MKKLATPRLNLSRETLRALTDKEIQAAAAGNLSNLTVCTGRSCLC